MSIKERLQADWIAAMKDKNKDLSNVLNMAKAAILQVEKTGNRKVEDDEAIAILSKEVKQRQESRAEFEKGGRQDLVTASDFEISTLQKYLPAPISEDELKELIAAKAEELGANNIKDMGKLMGALKPETNGRVDGKHLGELVKEHLNKK